MKAFNFPIFSNSIAPVTLSDLHADPRFISYFSMLQEYNTRFNLTTITTKEEVFLKHFLDSVLPLSLFPTAARMLDVGSGAGFPGVPLKLLRPDLDITLLDSVGKKVGFLEDLIIQLSKLQNEQPIKILSNDLQLKNYHFENSQPKESYNEDSTQTKLNFQEKNCIEQYINTDENNINLKGQTLKNKKENKNTVLTNQSLKINSESIDKPTQWADSIRAIKSRIEDFKIRDFDVVTSRAVAACNILAEYCLPFVRVGGLALFYKSDDVETELLSALPAIKLLGGEVEAVYKIPLIDNVLRSFVLIRKIMITPEKFPRGGNKPRLSPL